MTICVDHRRRRLRQPPWTRDDLSKKAHALNNRHLLHGGSNFDFVVRPHRNVLSCVQKKEPDKLLSKKGALICGPLFRAIRGSPAHKALFWGDALTDVADTW